MYTTVCLWPFLALRWAEATVERDEEEGQVRSGENQDISWNTHTNKYTWTRTPAYQNHIVFSFHFWRWEERRVKVSKQPHFICRVSSPSFSFMSRSLSHNATPADTSPKLQQTESLAPGSKELALSSPAASRAHGHLRPAQILTNHQTVC